jgi:hypothetical protein
MVPRRRARRRKPHPAQAARRGEAQRLAGDQHRRDRGGDAWFAAQPGTGLQLGISPSTAGMDAVEIAGDLADYNEGTSGWPLRLSLSFER